MESIELVENLKTRVASLCDEGSSKRQALEQIASICGVTYSWLFQIERAGIKPNTSYLLVQKLGKGLGMKP